MVTTEKPNGITITVRDRKNNKSKSITVYGTNVDEIVSKMKKVLG